MPRLSRYCSCTPAATSSVTWTRLPASAWMRRAWPLVVGALSVARGRSAALAAASLSSAWARASRFSGAAPRPSATTTSTKASEPGRAKTQVWATEPRAVSIWTLTGSPTVLAGTMTQRRWVAAASSHWVASAPAPHAMRRAAAGTSAAGSAAGGVGTSIAQSLILSQFQVWEGAWSTPASVMAI